MVVVKLCWNCFRFLLNICFIMCILAYCFLDMMKPKKLHMGSPILLLLAGLQPPGTWLGGVPRSAYVEAGVGLLARPWHLVLVWLSSLESPLSVSRSSCLLARRYPLTQNMWTVKGGTSKHSIALKGSPILDVESHMRNITQMDFQLCPVDGCTVLSGRGIEARTQLLYFICSMHHLDVTRYGEFKVIFVKWAK